VALVVLVVLFGGYWLFASKSAPAEESFSLPRQVSVATVGELSGGDAPLSLVGDVTSVNEADIRAEAAGSVTVLSKNLGDTVAAGGIIAQLENSSERAAVLSAEGALEAAQANFDKVSSGNRSETVNISISANTKAQAALEQTRTSTVDTIKGIYGTNDDTIRSKLDVVFSNPRSNFPQLNVTTSNQDIVNKVTQERISVEALLDGEEGRASALSESSNLHAEIDTAIAETRRLKEFVDDVSSALNIAISTQYVSQTTISSYITVASAARTTLSASLASLSAAAQTLTAAESAATVAAQQLEQDTSGSRSEDTAAAKAAVKQAQGSYNAALANLDKKIIRSPIYGTVNNLSIKRGDFVTAYQQVAIVSNNGSLEIVAAVTAEDRSTIAVGNKVQIEGGYEGVVTKIAPAIDPESKKIEIRVGVPQSADTLTNGETVRLQISRTRSASESSAVLAIPVSALKIEANRSVVFSVDEEGLLRAHVVTTGDLLGDKIQILGGVDASLIIVTDARGLKEGQQVGVQQ
jgi:RND family efflux transporter MFP subunit